MMYYLISQMALKLIIFFSLCSLMPLAYAKKADPFAKIRHAHLILPNKKRIQVKLAITTKEQSQGLSGVKIKNFKKNMGLLFAYAKTGPHRFWMPNTYFNLDIIFLDKNLKINGIVWNAPAHPGYQDPSKIYVTKEFNARYVLEVSSIGKVANGLKAGQQLKLDASFSLLEIESKIRHLK